MLTRDAETNPEGHILVAVAENKLNSNAFKDKMQQVLSASPIPSWVMNYTMCAPQRMGGWAVDVHLCCLSHPSMACAADARS